MWLQHGEYWNIIGVLVDRPRMKYLAAARLLQMQTPYAEALRELRGFDHRGVQDAHDAIAAWFRWVRKESRQYQLGESKEDHVKRLKREWRDFFVEEVERLCADDEFVRMVCKAAVKGISDAGDAVDLLLGEYLLHRYAESGMGKPKS